jgi:hypothetical protein
MTSVNAYLTHKNNLILLLHVSVPFTPSSWNFTPKFRTNCNVIITNKSYYFFRMKPRDALISKFILVRNSTCFGQFLCPSWGVFHSTFGTGTCYKGLTKTCVQDQDGTTVPSWPCTQAAEQFHPDCAWKRSSKICMKLTSAECTVENSWWWAEKMPETCRVL